MMHQSGMTGAGMMGSGYMLYGWLFQLIILVLFFLIIWWMLKGSCKFGFGTNDTAIDILKKRLASGEIDSKEFERLKKEIE